MTNKKTAPKKSVAQKKPVVRQQMFTKNTFFLAILAAFVVITIILIGL